VTKYFQLLLAAIVVLVTFAAVKAQTTGSVTGTITDPNGAIVPGARVTLISQMTRAEQSAVTNDAGGFNFAALQPGTYMVTVVASGFKRTEVPNVVVELSKPTQLTIPLTIGLQGETVTVTSAQDVVNTSSPTLTNVINTRQVVDLPLPTRNPLDLASLQAGIAVVGSDTRGASVGGLRQTSTNVTQDGINAMDNYVKTSSFFAISSPSLNSVSEFSITTNTVGSEAGRGVGQVNLVTKGGSNDFHGGIFYLHRNDVFNANTWFNNADGTERELLRQHFFGFDIGGPVFFPNFGDGGPGWFNGKDTAFFFFSYEGFRENFSTSRNRTVLTQDARNGIFRYNRVCPSDPDPDDPPCTPGVETVNLLDVGNVHALNPITRALLASTPLPNNTSCGANDTFNISCFRYNVTGSDPNDKYVGRYDHQLVKNSSYGAHKLEVVFNRAHFFLGPDTFNGIEAPFVGGINAFQESKRWLVTGALVSNFGSSITNVFRYGKQWAPVGFLRESNAAEPYILFSGITNPQNTFQSQGRNTVVDQYTDNASWATGKHLFRFGGDYQKIFADTFNDAGINQTITMGTNSANPSGVTLDDFPFATTAIQGRASSVYANIVGNLASSQATFNVISPDSGFVPGATRSRLFREQDLALYVQDQWRMWPNLTFNVGVRWDWMGVPTIPNGLAIQLTDPDQVWGVSGVANLFHPDAPFGAAPAVGTLDFVSGNTGIPLYNDDWNNFAPFVGIAWSPDFKSGFLHSIFGSPGRSSIRMGYSISYLHDGFTVISNALGTGTTNPGLIQTSAETTPVGVLTAAGVPLTTPDFNIPITDRANNLLNPNNGVWTIDRNLKTPYVQQWNVGYEREIFPNTALEVRYVGNHAVKVWRAVDLNEVNIFENGFLQEFKNAQINLALNGNSFADPAHGGVAGTIPLPILSRFFSGFSNTSTSAWRNSGFINNLRANNVGSFGSTLAFSNTYRSNRENPARGIPANFFVVNPNAAFSRILTNDSMSNYHALEVELRRRFSGGLQFQADYTFSKAMTDAPGGLGNNQSDLTSFRTLRDKSLDYTRSSQDQTHRFVANAIYELPFGKGRYWFSGANGFAEQFIGGWNVGAIVTWATRPPWYVVSGRTTFNNFNSGSAPAKLNGITFEEFKSHLGLFKTSDGVFFIDPTFIERIQEEDLLTAPEPGEWGDFPINSLNGPRYFNIDLSVTKRWSVTEKVRLELKTTFINILNHPNFTFGNQSIDSASFGRITGQSGSERVIHFTGSLRF
jgi:hypothetical protein